MDRSMILSLALFLRYWFKSWYRSTEDTSHERADIINIHFIRNEKIFEWNRGCNDLTPEVASSSSCLPKAVGGNNE
ncbi:hypothetical protein TNCV_1965831 [Trichonephila clavipes]|nr:hypothetical protein TNCV_1965831 [Trichonephila clavipes]